VGLFSSPQRVIRAVLVSQVLAGGWLTILPQDLASFLTQGKPLSLVRLEGPATGHAVGLIAPGREPHTPVLEALLTEARRREYYEKPTAMRKRKAAAAVKRYLKKLARSQDRMQSQRRYR